MAQLAGPAPHEDLGGYDGRVPMDALARHVWLYESDHYQSLLDKARLTDPTPMTYAGETITIRHACINRRLLPCILLEQYLAPNLLERTNGKLRLEVNSFPELGIAGPDVLYWVTDGTLDSATIYGGYVSGGIPSFEIQNFWGIHNSPAIKGSRPAQAIMKDLENLVLAETGGVIMNRSWFAGNDQFLFCREKIESLDDFEGKRTRSHSAALSHWINGMGASAQFLAFAEVYTALERGILDCAVTGANPGYSQRWYEVADYMMGPLYSYGVENNVINREVWNSIPADLQQIILEEAAKSELEALRLAAVQNEIGLQRNIDAGMEFVPFSGEIKAHGLNVTIDSVIPEWVTRVGDTSHPIITETFNNKLGPIVGLRITPDGSVVRIN